MRDKEESKATPTRNDFMRQQAIAVFELTKGFTPEQRKSASNAFNTVEEMAGYVLELTAVNEQDAYLSLFLTLL